MSDHLVIGGQLGNYLIDSVIGRGGMSVVYRATHTRLGTSVALKVLAPELSSDDTFRERFLREAQMAAGVDHPNVIPIHDMGLHENSLYIIMRYVSGGDLKALLASSGPLDPEQALVLLTPVALALDAAHAEGLVHRDVKPANILIQRSSAGETEHVYLTDFGIAKSTFSMSGLTSAGAVIGTVDYMAPEQIEGGELSAQTDVYALAATFYECVTGRLAVQRDFGEGTRPSVGEARPLSSVRPDLPPALDGALAEALSRDPHNRPPTCLQFLNACAQALEGRRSEADAPAAAPVARTVMSPGDGESRSEQPAAPERAAAPEPAPAHREGDHDGDGRRPSRRLLYGAALVAALGGALAVVLLSASSSPPAGALSSSALAQVPTNHVTGSGTATVRLNGDVATVSVTTNGLDNGETLVHAMHIHAGGKGQCPPASAARLHNGHLTISTTDGINYYGPPVLALTTHGDTSPASILALPRFLSGGTLRYSRRIILPASVAAYIRRNNAVVVVHGTDYDHSGIYSGVLERSELDNALPATATAPALCGPLVGPQVTASKRPSRRTTLVYSASLDVNTAISISPLEQILCQAPEAASAPGESRRQASASAA